MTSGKRSFIVVAKLESAWAKGTSKKLSADKRMSENWVFMTNQSLGIRLLVCWFGLFFVFVKIIEEVVDFLLNLDRDGMIKGNVVFGLEGRATDQ